MRIKYNSVGNTAVTALLIFFLLASLGFGGWAFAQAQDYKNNVDTKIAAAVADAKKNQAAELQKQFEEDYKKPNRTYRGDPTYGSVTFDYPKTWSAYVEESDSAQPINGYFYPDKVPKLNSGTAYALRVELVNTQYSQIVHSYDSQVKLGKVKVTAYTPPKVKGAPNAQPGIRLDGNLATDQQPKTGSMVILPVRDKTLKISTEAPNFMADFNNSVLASLSYSP